MSMTPVHLYECVPFQGYVNRKCIIHN
jgi:hypothetical protein